MKWCLWCGESLTVTRREVGDFCNSNCCKEYYRDIGGFEWILDFLSNKAEKEETVIKVNSEVK